MRHRRRKRGFVLLVALVLVFLAGVALTALARRSLAGALASRGAVEELQRRWAVTSLRAVLLERAEDLLDEAERGRDARGKPMKRYRKQPMPERRVTCLLAGIEYELVLTDEQAKVNLNRMVEELGQARAQSAIGRFIMRQVGADGRTVALELRTQAFGQEASGAGAIPVKVGAYGQIFEKASPARLVGTPQEPGLAAAVTCWGDGKVNLRRAPPEVLMQACEQALGRSVVSVLLAARQRDPYRGLDAVFAELDEIDDDQREKVREYVTDTSTCHGLWIVAKGERRSWHTLAVGVSGGGRAAGSADGQELRQYYEFSW